MNRTSDFIIENGVLREYLGPKGNVVVPDGVKVIGLNALWKLTGSEIHLPATVEKIEWGNAFWNNPAYCRGTLGERNTVYAPTGSWAEREINLTRIPQFQKRNGNCRLIFQPEGEPVSPDDSSVRCERNMYEWRKYYLFSHRKKGSHVAAYLRSSKIVYLPDHFGKPQVTSIGKTAFQPDTAVLCSKRLFTKLNTENKTATVRYYISNQTPFLSDEAAYLKEYIKKQMEQIISWNDPELLRKCLNVIQLKPAVYEKCLESAERLNNAEIKAVILDCKNAMGQ